MRVNPSKTALAIVCGAALAAVSCGGGSSTPAPAATAKPFSVVEASIPETQAAMREGRVTSRQIVTEYLTRIGLYEDRLNVAIAVNPNALAEADALDKERAEGKLRGPLHGDRKSVV